jgi:hypothetical protein
MDLKAALVSEVLGQGETRAGKGEAESHWPVRSPRSAIVHSDFHQVELKSITFIESETRKT